MKRLILIGIPLLLTTAACGSSSGDDKTDAPSTAATSQTTAPSATPTTPSEPQTVEGARAMAVENGKRFGAQDFAGAWDYFDRTGKAAIPKDEYVAYAKACDLGGMPLEVDDIRLDSKTEATVRYEVMGYTQARTLVYEDGLWKGKATDDTLNLFKEGTAEAAIKAAKADGGC